MTKEHLWNIILEKNPSFVKPDAHITLTARGLKKLFDNAYQTGFDSAMSRGADSDSSDHKSDSGFFDSFTKGLFRGKK